MTFEIDTDADPEMSKNWIYDHDEPKARYSLGQTGKNPLIGIGVNPSTAVPGNLDPTVAGVARFAAEQGYDGWIMLNVYPQRATNPNNMHKRFQKQFHQKNMEAVERLVHKPLDVWCAWGTLIEKRPYLNRCMQEMYEILENAGCSYYRRGAISKAGHPHHPLYLRKTEPMVPFDMNHYTNTVINNLK
jgi:hypothetical protein